MSASSMNDFQKQVSELLLRHRSLLDILSKRDQAGATVHRAVIKAVTECGCIEITGKKQNYTAEMTVEEARQSIDTHVSGQLCDACRETVSERLGRELFYLASLCNVLNINMDQVMAEESSKCSTLGFFNMA